MTDSRLGLWTSLQDLSSFSQDFDKIFPSFWNIEIVVLSSKKKKKKKKLKINIFIVVVLF